MTRSYTAAERDRAVIRAQEIGDQQASTELGIPRRTLSRWRHRPEQKAVILASREQLVDRYRAAEGKALDRLLDQLDNPRTPVHHVARALEIIGNRLALLQGSPTAISANLNVTANGTSMSEADARQLRQWLDALERLPDDELAVEMMPALISAGYINSPSTAVNIDDDAVRADDHAD
jgi:hypothetical protein